MKFDKSSQAGGNPRRSAIVTTNDGKFGNDAKSMQLFVCFFSVCARVSLRELPHPLRSANIAVPTKDLPKKSHLILTGLTWNVQGTLGKSEKVF